MAFSPSTSHLLLLVSTMIYIFVSTCRYASAYNDPHLGAAGVVANKYVPQAEAEGETDDYYPQPGDVDTDPGVVGTNPGVIGTNPGAVGANPGVVGANPGVVGANPGPLFTKALECLHDKYIYSRCDEAYRLTENGEVNVPPEYTDHYCKGPCLKETHLVLECIDEIIKHFVFYNKATVKDVKETIEGGCSYGPKRGDFNVAEHIEAEEDIGSRVSTPVFYASLLMIMGWQWHVMF